MWPDTIRLISRTLLYEDHSICAWAARDRRTRQYIPVSSITWRTIDGSTGIHLLKNSLERYRDFDEACASALAAAKTWINRRLGYLD
jgi:hypothetical protein